MYLQVTKRIEAQSLLDTLFGMFIERMSDLKGYEPNTGEGDWQY